jgi:hypothetical protein
MARKQIYIVYHSAQKCVWKRMFFMKKEEALPAVKDFYRLVKDWKNRGEDCIWAVGQGSFRVMPLQEFTKRSDIPLSDTTKWLKSVNNEPIDISY